MLARWLSYPSASDSVVSFRVMFYPVGSTLPTNTSFEYLHQGSASRIGNRSCTHYRVDLDLNPIDAKYVVTPIPPTTYYYLRWACSGLKYSRWSSILGGCGRTRVKREYRTDSVFESFITVSQAIAGSVAVTTETMVSHIDSMKDSGDVCEYLFTPHPSSASLMNMTCTISSLLKGRWTKRTITGTCPSGSVNVDLSTESIDAKSIWMAHGSKFITNSRKYLSLKEFGELTDDCMQRGGKAYQTNTLQYLLELRQLSTLLSPYLRLIRGGMTARSAASAWLSHYYGTRLTVKDTYAQISGLIRYSGRRVMAYDKLQSRSLGSYSKPDGTAFSGYRSLTVYHSVHSNWMSDTYRALRSYGLNPSLSLAWDLVPLSFVVDWISPIGEALAQFDGNTFSESLQILESIITEKFEQTSSAALMGFSTISGSVRFSYYDRRVMDRRVPRPVFRFDPISFSGMKALNGVALVVQRRP